MPTVLFAAVFVLLVAMSVWHRLRVLHAVALLPEDLRERLGWHIAAEVAPRRHARRIARRLLVRGLPGWVPLPDEARRDLRWHRLFGFGAVVYIVLVLPAAWGAWNLVPVLGLFATAILAVQSWLDGPWGDAR